jgi:sulfate adenylyltransferase subunit 2
VRSTADTIPKIIEELVATKHSERQLRVIDHDQDASMEMKKREGYF